MTFSLQEVHPSWHSFFASRVEYINDILSRVEETDFTPLRADVFRVFTLPKESYRLIIIGQDPYPGRGVAHGLAFSQSSAEKKVPASLRNIFKELSTDLEMPMPTTTDLSSWATSGVMLLNRSLTTTVGEANAHKKFGWWDLTEDVAQEMGKSCVGILWGKNAQLLSPYFTHSILSAHPSPLSARHGFFGSKPFSRANQLLESQGKRPIDWKL